MKSHAPVGNRLEKGVSVECGSRAVRKQEFWSIVQSECEVQGGAGFIEAHAFAQMEKVMSIENQGGSILILFLFIFLSLFFLRISYIQCILIKPTSILTCPILPLFSTPHFPP